MAIKMMVSFFMAFFVWIVLFSYGTVASAMTPQDPCPLISTDREWSTECFVSTKGDRQVRKQYRKNLVFDRNGTVAIVIKAPPELVVVNRSGKVVEATEARLSAFIFEPGEGQIARFGYAVSNPKTKGEFRCGFYRRVGNFKVLVPPVYDQCDGFSDGNALVCIGCTNFCESGDCHHTDFIGGEGVIIDESNHVIKRFQLPALPRCEQNGAKSKGDPTCRN